MTKKKSPAGRKKIPDSKKAVPVTVYVKKENKPKALAICLAAVVHLK